MAMANKTVRAGEADLDIYKLFGTDQGLEQDGIILNYSDVFWLRVSRAGGSNERYKRILTEKTRPYRRAIQTETILPDMAAKIMREAAAEGLVLAWGSKKFGDGLMPAPDGTPMEFTVENVVKFFEALPDIFADVQEQTGKAGLFRLTEIEDDAKNS
jgi:hypothetical protein